MLMRGRALLPRVGEMDKRRHDCVPWTGETMCRADQRAADPDGETGHQGRRPKVSQGEGAVGPALGLPRRKMWGFGLCPVAVCVFCLSRDFAPGTQNL